MVKRRKKPTVREQLQLAVDYCSLWQCPRCLYYSFPGHVCAKCQYDPSYCLVEDCADDPVYRSRCEAHQSYEVEWE